MKTRLSFTVILTALLAINSYAQKHELWGLGPTPGYIYKLDSNGTNKTIVYYIKGVNGYGPGPTGSLLQASNKKLYGMTHAAGSSNLGTLFEYDIKKQTYSIKVNFNDSIGDKPDGNSLIQASNGKLYGMTTLGGSYDKGVVFEYDPLANHYTKLFDFSDSLGTYPHGRLLQIADSESIIFYGLATKGGYKDGGVLFKFNLTDSSYEVLHHFDGYYPYHKETGRFPYGSLLQADDGKLYGMTSEGGLHNNGVLFVFDPDSRQFKKKLDFNDNETGKRPKGSLIQAVDGKLYGVTQYGGDNYAGGGGNAGMVFSFDIEHNTFAKRADLGNGVGTYPLGSLLQASGGKMFGTSYLGACSSGGVFCYDPATDTIYRTACNGYPQGNLIEIEAIYPETSDTLSVESCVEYRSPSGRHRWTASGVYLDTIPNTAGGDSIITIYLTIKTVDVSVIQNGASLEAQAENAGYQWLSCDNDFQPLTGDTNQVFRAVRYGHYAVSVSQEGCVDTSACYAIRTVGINSSNRKNEVFSAAGGDAEGNTGSVSYTVGQIVYTTISGDSAMVAQGIQQPYEITVATAIKNTEDILLDVVAYPNPVRNLLKLKMKNRNFGHIYYQLFDNNGNVMEQKEVTGSETYIPMQGLPRATYYLKVIYKGNTAEKGMKTFKIIKK